MQIFLFADIKWKLNFEVSNENGEKIIMKSVHNKKREIVKWKSQLEKS